MDLEGEVASGEGTFGVVRVGYDPERQCRVAVKRFKNFRNDNGFSVDFVRETLLLQACKHDSIVQMYAVIHDTVVMESMDCNLRDEIKRCGAFSEDRVSLVMRQLYTGITVLHANGIVHRDVTASNVLVKHGMQVKLCDLGAARWFEPRQTAIHRGVLSQVPFYSEQCGTLWYRAPELLLGGTYDERIDVWSAGCVDHEIRTGLALFKSDDGTEWAQMLSVFQKCGTPTTDTWPGCTLLPHYQPCPAFKKSYTFHALVDAALQWPHVRPTAKEMLRKYDGDVHIDHTTPAAVEMTWGDLHDVDRMRWVDWIVRVCQTYEFLDVTCHLAVAYFDAVLPSVTTSMVKRVAGACVLLATKMHELAHITVDDLAQKLSCTIQPLLDAEVWVHTKLMTVPAVHIRDLVAYQLTFLPPLPIDAMQRAWRVAKLSLYAHQLPRHMSMSDLRMVCLGVGDTSAFDALEKKIQEFVRRKRPIIEID